MNKEEEEEEDNLCTFCTFPLKVKLEEEKKKKNIIRLTKCKHAFHRECFKRWHVWRQKEWEREMREMNWPKGSEEEKRARAKPTHECPLCRVEVEERFDFSKSNNIRPYFKTILFFINRILPKLMIAFMDSQLLLFILVINKYYD